MRWPEEVKQFVIHNSFRYTRKELAAELEERFRFSTTPLRVQYFCNDRNLPIKSETTVYPKGLGDFIRDNCKGLTSEETSKAVEEHFHIIMPAKAVAAYRKNHKIPSGCDKRFGHGQKMYKPQKGTYSPGREKGWFKKGNTPHNTDPVGTVVKRQDGYLQRKIAEPNLWKLEHKFVWEEANGPVPDGKCLIFLNGKRDDCRLENLKLVDRGVMSIMSTRGLRFEEPEFTETGSLIAEVLSKTRRKT